MVFCSYNYITLLFFLLYINSFSQENQKNTIIEKTKKNELPPETIQSEKESKNSRTESVTIIENQKLKNSIGGFSEILKKINSIRINELGGVGQFATALIRGSNGKQIKIFKDGIPLTNNRDGQINLGKINLKDIESVEIYKGYCPANLASNSSGAVINILTNQNPSTASQIETSTTYGSFDTFLFHTSIDERNKKNFISINLDHNQSKNNFKFYNNKGTPYNHDDDFVDRKRHNGYKDYTIDHTFGTYTDNGQWSYFLSNIIGEQEIGGPKNTVINSAVNKFSDIDANIKIKNKLSDKIQLESTLYANNEIKNINDPLGEIGFSIDKVKETNYALGFKNFLSININQNIFTNILIDALSDKFIKSNKLSFQNSSWRRDTISFCIEYGQISNSKKWEFKINGLIENFNDTSSVHQKNQTSDEGTYPTSKASTQYTSDNDYQFKFSCGQDLRVPSLYEKYGDSGLITGNSDLKNEEYLFAETSIQKKWEFNKNLKEIETILTLYGKRGEDIITYQQFSAGVAKPINIDKTITFGIEYQLNFNHEFFELVNQIDVTDAENDSTNSYLNGKQIPGIPKYRFYSELTFKLKNWSCYYRCELSSKEYFDEANIQVENEKLIQDAGIKYIYKKFEIKFEIKNIGDIQREDFVNYPLPGRSYWLQMNITF